MSEDESRWESGRPVEPWIYPDRAKVYLAGASFGVSFKLDGATWRFFNPDGSPAKTPEGQDMVRPNCPGFWDEVWDICKATAVRQTGSGHIDRP